MLKRSERKAAAPARMATLAAAAGLALALAPGAALAAGATSSGTSSNGADAPVAASPSSGTSASVSGVPDGKAPSAEKAAPSSAQAAAGAPVPIDGPKEGVAGGWYYYGGAARDILPEEAAQAFEKAVDGMVGSDLVPVALLATQVVSGTNYMVLCTSTPVVPDAETSLCVAVVYEDLEGNAELRSIKDFDALAYTE